jgi:hypothetical protein
MLARDVLVDDSVRVQDLVCVPGIETQLQWSSLARKITGVVSQKNTS